MFALGSVTMTGSAWSYASATAAARTRQIQMKNFFKTPSF